MFNLPRWTVFVLAIVLFGVAFVSPVAAQNCPGVVIDDSMSSTKLNRASICDAAHAWTSSYQVYVFLTDYSPRNEDDWFSVLDAFEESQGIRNAQGFLRTAVAFEASTTLPSIYTANLTVGEGLAHTPLWNDQVRDRQKGEFRNLLNQGQVNEAFVHVISSSYQTAFPPATTPPRPVPTAVVVPAPVTNVQVDTAPIVSGLGQVLTLAFIVVAASGVTYVLLVYVVIPFSKVWHRNQRYRGQIALVSSRAARILTAGNQLFAGAKVEDTTLYGLWDAFGGTSYPEKDKALRRSLESARQAVVVAQETFTQLKRQEKMALEEAVKSWETLYITLVGTSSRILAMTEAEQEALLNPLTVLERTAIEDDLVRQIDEVFQGLQGHQTLAFEPLIIDPDDFHAEGILGLVDLVKAELHILQTAKLEAGPLVEQARISLEELERGFEIDPAVLNRDEAYLYPRATLAHAVAALEAELWIEAQQGASSTISFVRSLPELLDAYTRVVEEADKHLAEFVAIEAQGFRLDSLKTLVEAVEQDRAEFLAALAAGDLTRAEEYIEEIEADAEYAAAQARALPALQKQNAEALAKLSQEVARLQGYIIESVEPAMAELQSYPASNWGGVEENITKARAILAPLFDDPTDESDLASTIARENSLEQQAFAAAEQALVEAFAQSGEAEQLLKTVVAQLVLVHEIERQGASSLQAAEADLNQAVQRRDQHDVKVDAKVDATLSELNLQLEIARQALTRREFTTASQLIAEVRQGTTHAYQEVDEQIQAIDNALVLLEERRRKAVDAVKRAVEANKELPPAAQEKKISTAVSKVMEALEAAQQRDQAIAGLEDRAWLQALTETCELYKKVQRQAEGVTEQAHSAYARYQAAFEAARSAISAAESEIAAAGRTVRDSDAGGSGRNALRRAETTLPSGLEFGIAYEALSRLQQQAMAAETAASQARREAQAEIQRVQAARAAAQRERERQEAERRRQEQEAARRRMSSSSSSFGSSSSSSSFGSSASRSSFSSSSSRGSSFGSSKR